jgi:2-amino-4-hydroxy-6-hydroxymethyldihydropteridine diphosphokinase
MTKAYVGLGANLGDREQMLRLALERLAAEPSIELVASSTLRETEPEDLLDQPLFLNGAAVVETDLSPRQLLARLQLIECELCFSTAP